MFFFSILCGKTEKLQNKSIVSKIVSLIEEKAKDLEKK